MIEKLKQYKVAKQKVKEVQKILAESRWKRMVVRAKQALTK